MIDNNIYNRDVLELAANIPRIGRLEEPVASATKHARLCGSTATVDIELGDGVVTDFAMEVQACALGQAAASAVARAIIGASPTELREAQTALRKMLKEGGPPPTGRFAALSALEPARDYGARHPAIMLVLDAILEALDRSEQPSAVRAAGLDEA